MARLFAKLLTSTPDPLPKLVISACAAVLAEFVVLEMDDEVAVVPVPDVLLDVEVTGVTI